MSLPTFSSQGELFSTAGLSARLFAPTDRYRLFAKLVYPHVARARAHLEPCYCAENGRTALEPVLMLGVSLLQELDGAPDRQAVELLRYHAGWNFALNRQLGDRVFHPTSLVNFRHRLNEHQQSSLAFKTVLDALVEAGLVSRQSRQRLDSTQMFGRVARMNRLDCVRESLRLALQELEGLREADAWSLLEWLRAAGSVQWARGPQVQLLRRVFGEQFEVVAGQSAPVAREKERVEVDPGQEVAEPAGLGTELVPSAGTQSASAVATDPPACGAPGAEGQSATIRPKGKGELSSDRVQNPHDPEASYAVKGQGQQKKEHVGYKVQVAETVSEEKLAPGEPTCNFLTGIVTHRAHQSDEVGAVQMEEEQARMGLAKPSVQYVDGAYVSAQKLAEAQAEGRELMGPAQPAPRKEGRFSVEDFQIDVEQRTAVCPAGKRNTQCSRLVEEATGKVDYRFEFSTQCHDCALREGCLGKDQRHRTLVVGEHHTQSELVRGHGLRRARYRGLAKAKLQNYFIGAACNVKRWLRREAWQIRQAAAATG